MAIERQSKGRLTKDESHLWKLLSSRDIGSIQQGIDIACSLGNEVSGVLSGVDVRESSGELLRGDRFLGAGPSQPYLDFALLGILSGAYEGSIAASIRSRVRKLVITIPAVPRLRGFSALEDLQLTIQDGCHLSDLSSFDQLPALISLMICGEQKTPYTKINSSLSSLIGLDAPLLRIANLSEINLTDLGNIGQEGCLEFLDLSKNELLSNINVLSHSVKNIQQLNLASCKSIRDIHALTGSAKLESINLSECESLESIKGLIESINLREINLVACQSLKSLEGLKEKKIDTKKVSDYDDSKTFSLRGCASLTDLNYFPELGDDVTGL